MVLEPGPGSRFGGFLFADLRGYTAFVESHGDQAAVHLLERYRSLVREVVSGFSGAEIRTEGDSFYVVFPSASRAVSAGLAIVADAARRTAEEPAYPIAVGVGVHAGETAETDEGPVGSAVNLAARVCSEARAGEVLVSDTVRGLTRTSGQFSFTAVGARKLKGIDEPVSLYRARSVDDAGATADGPAGRRRRRIGGAVAIGLVAVLGIAALIGLLLGSWSGSATRIIFTLYPTFGDQPGCGSEIDAKLFVVDPAHPEVPPFRITSGTDALEASAAWSSDGSVLAFSATAPRRQPLVYAWDASQPAPEVLTEGLFASNLAVSNDGAAVAWPDPDGAGIVLALRDGPTPVTVPVSDGTSGTGWSPIDVAFLPDGRLLVLAGRFTESSSEYLVATMAADGSDLVAVPVELAGELGEVIPAPDGLRFLLSEFREEGTAWHLVSIADGSDEPIQLPANLGPAAWSPDGGQLVASGGPDAESQLFIVDAATGASTQLTHLDGASACAPVWGPASGAFAVAAPTPAPSGTPQRFEYGALPPGRYLVSELQPNMEMTIDASDWYARRNWVDGWSIKNLAFDGSELDAGRIQVGLLGPCSDAEQVTLGSSPSDVIDWITGRQDLMVSEPRAVNLGGFTGIEVDVSGNPELACLADPSDPSSRYWVVFFLGQDSVGLGEEEILRLSVVDVGGRSVAFLIFSFEDEIDGFAELARPVMESFAFPGE